MAAKFVVVVALFALCHGNPVLINGVLYRDGRAFSIGQAYNNGGGVSTAQANVHGHAAQAYSSSNDGTHLARDGYYRPGQAIAQAYSDENAYGAAKAVAQAQNGDYYRIPAPATVITYEQNFATPSEVTYEIPGADSSISSASSNGVGVAESSAKTQGGFSGYGATSSNAKSSGSGSANSNAISGYDSASTSAKTFGQGSAASSAQTNGVTGVVYPVAPTVQVQNVQPTIIDAKSPIFYTSYVPSVASSNANVIGSGNAASSAKIGQGRTISWHFGTLYDKPDATHSQANINSGYGAAKSFANSHGAGSANANANVNGYGSAKSYADTASAGHGLAQSSADSNGAGFANANANVNGYTGYGTAKSAANTYYGSALSTANTNTGFGNARSTADVHDHSGSRTFADAHTNGFGNAASSARTQGVNTAFRVTNSQAHSSGHGSAHANSLAV